MSPWIHTSVINMNFSFDILSGSIFRPFISMCLRSYYIGTMKIANSFDERIFLFNFFFHKPNTSNKNQPYSKPWISFLFSGMDKMNWWLFRNESNALLFQSNWIRAQCTHILFALTLTPIERNQCDRDKCICVAGCNCCCFRCITQCRHSLWCAVPFVQMACA